MLRFLLTVIVGFVAVIVLGIVIFIGYSVAGPFFEAIGGESHAVYGGMSGNSAINFGQGLLFLALSMLSVPASLLLYVFFSGDSGGRRPPRGGEPRRRQ